ncbi:hypothetical protein [Synechococcus sp. CCY 0621]|uniref:hypothetical protein n=1 Tax=Synechococcus sp. CCY 0621 TaxID=2815603 RepID=UPI001C21363C|nr:hypothetical protein [Synechococcus sp. CCY 0621]
MPELHECHGQKVPVLRLSSMLSWRHRLSVIQSTLEKQSVQWISLQYVPHAYSIKGAPVLLPCFLKFLKGNHRWHVMFHELWGVKRNQRPVIRSLVITLQRGILMALNRVLPISVAHTSNNQWRHQLAGVGVTAHILPLISNIPVFPIDSSARGELLSNFGIAELDSRVLILTFFGSIRLDWASMGLVDRVQNMLCRSPWSTAIFISVGRAGSFGEHILRRMEDKASRQCHFIRLGELLPEQISQTLHMSDVGISMNDIEQVGKSSSVAAMVDHGLPVILPASPNGYSAYNDSRLKTIPFDDHFESTLLASHKTEPIDSVHSISDALANALYGSL